MDFTLRLIEPADAPALHRFFDENFLFLSPWVAGMDRPVSDESSRLFTEEAVNDANNFSAIRLLVMVDSEIAGIVSLIKVDQLHGTAELGYILGEQFTGKGLATKACQATLDLCFSDFGLNRIEIAISESNIESHKVAARLKAVPEGLKRDGEMIHGEYVNQLVYSIIKSDWALVPAEAIAA